MGFILIPASMTGGKKQCLMHIKEQKKERSYLNLIL